MAESQPYRKPRGPFLADQVRDGDPYELSDGHAIRCLPTGGRGSAAAATGSAVLKSDPLVESSGVETGYSFAAHSLRAPDVAVGNVPDAPGWVKGVPPLAVEYADEGQDENELAAKIGEFLAAGTRHVWVVRLTGPRRVEVHEPGRESRTAGPGEELLAPGVLRNPVPIEALYDWNIGRRVTLRNLLQGEGYEDLDAVRDEGRSEGLAEGGVATLRESVLAVAEARGLRSSTLSAAVAGCADASLLRRWLLRAVTASAVDEIFAPAKT